MKPNTSQAGFSIVELLVASALFMTVVAVAAGAFVSVLDASAQSREMNVLMSNLDFALEDMSRNIRVGENFTITGNSQIRFEVYAPGSSEVKCGVQYRLQNESIEKSKEGPSLCSGYGFTAITSEEIIIDNLRFTGYSLSGSNQQPRITINLSGRIEGDTEQDFVLQTSVTQRVLELSS